MNIYLFFQSQREKHVCVLVSFCFLLENLEVSEVPFRTHRTHFLKQTWWMICHRICDMTGSQLNSRKVSWIQLSILVDEFVKVKVAEVQLALHCSKWQNPLPLWGRALELLLLKSVFKANFLKVLFAWAWTKCVDNHTGANQ